MPSLFDAHELMSANATDALMGRTLRITPGGGSLTNLGKPLAVDGREPLDVFGCFLEGDESSVFGDGDRRISDINARISRHNAVAMISRHRFPTGWEPKANDVLVTDHVQPRRFSIIKVLPLGSIRLVIHLAKAS